MRENSFPFVFEKGLYQWENERGDALNVCWNMKVDKKRLVGITALTNPITDPAGYVWPVTQDWPFPQLFVGKQRTYLCTRLGIYPLDSNFVPTIEVGVDERDTIWSFADFHDFVVFTNGVRLYLTSPSTGDVWPYGAWVDNRIPNCSCVCNYKGQLICGAPTGYDSNVVLWGDIGYANMELDAKGVIGFMPMPWQGEVLALRRLGDLVFVGGADGVAFLASSGQPMVGYGLREWRAVGLASAGAVGGSLEKLWFLDEAGSLWAVTTKPTIEELGYKDHLAQMLGNDVMMSWDELNQELYICDGVVCFLLTDEGLSQVHQLPSSVQAVAGTAIGTYADGTDKTVVVETLALDMGYRARKSVEWIELQAEGLVDTVLVGYKNSNAGSFVNSPAVRGNPMGVYRPKVSGNDLRIRLAANSFSDLTLHKMNVRWKHDDKRFLRGTNADKATA